MKSLNLFTYLRKKLGMYVPIHIRILITQVFTLFHLYIIRTEELLGRYLLKAKLIFEKMQETIQYDIQFYKAFARHKTTTQKGIPSVRVISIH